MTNDLAFGTSMDQILRFHSRYNTTFMYIFGYRSDIVDVVLPSWTGLLKSNVKKIA